MPRFDLVLLREAPLTPTELDRLLSAGAAWRRRRWGHITDLQLIALEGLGTHRVWAGFRYTEPDRELDELPQVALLLEQLLQAVPGARLRVRDDLAIFSHDRRQFTLKGSPALPELDPGWRPAEVAWLGTELPPPLQIAHGPPATEGELLDLLEIIERAGEDAPLIRAAAGGAVRYGPQLQALTARRQYAAGACSLLASLAQRELAQLHDNAGTAQQIILDGDARERAAARRLLEALSMVEVVAEVEIPDWSVVEDLGHRLLDALQPVAIDDPETDEGWEDDLLFDDLELISEPDAEIPESPLAEALRSLQETPLLREAGALSLQPVWSEQALAMLTGSDGQAAGAALLFALSTWPCRRLPGLTSTLHALAQAQSRPEAVRLVAVSALAETGRPDVSPLLIQLSRSASLDIAREAIRALGRVVGAAARRRVPPSYASRASVVRSESVTTMGTPNESSGNGAGAPVLVVAVRDCCS